MARLFYHTMQDNAGNLLFGVSGTMRLAGSGTLATIYGDEALTVILPNPMTNHPSYGSFKCYLAPGSYDFYMAKAGYTFETLTGVQGLGTMAQQNSNQLVVTGGDITGLNQCSLSGAPGQLYVGGTSRFNDAVGIRQAPIGPVGLGVSYNKATSEYGIVLTPTGADTGTPAMLFKNVATTDVGAIYTTATATAYNTSSDARLKHAITTLVGELAVIRALRPVRFRWRADDAEGVGFIAGEVAEHVQGVVTGEPDAVEDDGSIRPQMIDMSKLVPWLVGAVQTLAAQVETLTERVQALESALGV